MGYIRHFEAGKKNCGGRQKGCLVQALIAEKAPQANTGRVPLSSSREEAELEDDGVSDGRNSLYKGMNTQGLILGTWQVLSVTRGVEMESKARMSNYKAHWNAGVHGFICLLSHQSRAPYSPIEHFSWIYQGASIKSEQGILLDAGRGSHTSMSCGFHSSFKANTRPPCAFHRKE